MLEQLLQRLMTPHDPHGRVLYGTSNNEDAAIVALPPAGMALVQTVDVLAPLSHSPRLFGQIAAANALSDVYAMGGEAWSAMNIVAFPTLTDPIDALADILAGGLDALTQADCVLAGGHTLEATDITYGLSVTGIVDPACVTRNDGLRSGDVLILTKPLGTGVLATGLRANWGGEAGAARCHAAFTRWTARLNRQAARVIRAMRLAAATDITGFGLGGHALEMARASNCTIELDTNALPFMDDVLELAENGFIPAVTYVNRSHCQCRTHIVPGVDSVRATLVFDAQTSGGLLLAVPAARVDEALERLHALGEGAWPVGRVTPLQPTPHANAQLVLA